MRRFVRLVLEHCNMLPCLTVAAALYAIISGGVGLALLEESRLYTISLWGIRVGCCLLVLGGIPLSFQCIAWRKEAREMERFLADQRDKQTEET